MSFVPVLMAYDAAPDAPVYMTHAGMMERVRYLERWSRQHKNLCDDRHKWTVDRVKWMVDRVNYLTGKIEALSRNIDKYLGVKTDAVLDIKTDMDRLRTNGEAMLARRNNPAGASVHASMGTFARRLLITGLK